MSPKYIRLNVMFPGETSCRNGTEGYLCLNVAGPKGRKQQSLTCTLFWNWKQPLLCTFSCCLELLPSEDTRCLRGFGPRHTPGTKQALRRQWVGLTAPGPGPGAHLHCSAGSQARGVCTDAQAWPCVTQLSSCGSFSPSLPVRVQRYTQKGLVWSCLSHEGILKPSLRSLWKTHSHILYLWHPPGF